MIINTRTTSIKTNTNKPYFLNENENEKERNKTNFYSKDKVELGLNNENPATYSKDANKKLNSIDLEKIKLQADQATLSLRKIVETLILKQGKIKNSLNINYSINYSYEDANAAISDGGEWGVEAVSDRIVDFAKAVSGGDRSKLEVLTAAIDKGFKLAGKSFSNGLPDICNKTYNRIMEKLNDWKNELKDAV